VPLRDGPLGSLRAPLYWAAGAAVVLTLAGAIALFMSDRRESLTEGGYGAVRQAADRVQAPITGVLSAPVRWVESGTAGVRGYFGAVSENRRLRTELEAMNELQAELALKDDLIERYTELLGLRIDPPIEMVSGRAVSDARGPYANSRLINVGSEAEVKVGHPVMSENGLVGRVVGVAPGVSRVLLLTDVASAVPVMIDRTNARAVLTGDGGPAPLMAYMRGRDEPEVGDVVVTSGDGGLFPRGLPVGQVVRGVDGNWRVRLASDRAPIDFVRVLKFESFAQLADTERLSDLVEPVQMSGETVARSQAGEQSLAPAQPAEPAAQTPGTPVSEIEIVENPELPEPEPPPEREYQRVPQDAEIVVESPDAEIAQ
jgi:rod shape-determining protein MreC